MQTEPAAMEPTALASQAEPLDPHDPELQQALGRIKRFEDRLVRDHVERRLILFYRRENPVSCSGQITYSNTCPEHDPGFSYSYGPQQRRFCLCGYAEYPGEQ